MTAASAPDTISQAKAALRRTIIERRDAADAGGRARDSKIITQKLTGLPAYRAAGVVAAYASFGSEVDTSEFLARILKDGKQLLLPRINRKRHALELRRVADLGADLVSGVWGIREPAEHCPLPTSGPGFMLVPGVAFTLPGARLGYGGGYYDRLLASLDRNVARVVAAFDLQVVDKLPEAPHDQRVDRVITEIQPSLTT